ncbi:MAG TPA: hypothetical protein VHV30_14925 [Polyangiaceae bacterium]|jgi:hypothetical protein|nr:hypothetical protein [Polyangiaceae bacterium]
MRASGRAGLWLTGGAGAVALALLGSCSGAAPNDLLDAPPEMPDATNVSNVDSGRHDSGSSSGAMAEDDASESGPPGNCGAATCADGCCDENGHCQSGDQDTQCGSGGANCLDCTGENGTCAAKTCLVSSTSSSSGSGSGSSGSGSGSSSGSMTCNPLVCPACVFTTACCKTNNTGCGCTGAFNLCN